uniref:Poly [ADP-ribose] polymerase n=1 Tax=Amphora coffeiformis TaxID=265554 RepID=A0A7S3LFQ9_9STRA|mmetsp:Transcript_17082/g.32418  ORF Transcript_17082/g.32418 Transcript_17082/m.32418 type:complete len:448 (+) Transcript_17082:581-1924(+)
MRAAISDYVPKASNDIKETARPPPKVQWCWKETDFCMDNHDEDDIFGSASDCWIKYGNSDQVEKAYQKQKGRGTFSPLTGYVLDFSTMVQTKQATGFEREVKRFVEKADDVDVDMKNVEVGQGLPQDLAGEPQMILVQGDIIQISKQREDGWAFGSKLHHENEALARKLLAVAVAVVGEGSSEDDAAILTDTGWFPLDKTQPPTGEELAVLQKQVGDTGELTPPKHWDPVVDPTTVQLHELREGDPERDAVVKSFLSTLVPPQFTKVKIVRVQRVQNLAMWQSYVVKRQTICYREHFDSSLGPGSAAYEKALERFERKWLWHGSNAEVMDKILQQGFNRSFCGKNATAYGKGVYFARDASYSAYRIYAVPDNKGIQYMMACRVVVGEYCKGHMDALTPDLRDASRNMLYDTTVGLLGSDNMSSPSIYVTYHDAQAYPEYLIAFKSSS